jgi:prevent-host-death family protein
MKIIGSSELKAHLYDLLREVREGEVIEVTHRGEPIARLSPIRRGPHLSGEEIRAVIRSIDELADEITADWPQDVGVADAVAEARR